MSQIKLVAVVCTISASSISDVRGFDILLANNKEVHSGIAPQYYFWDSRKLPIEDGVPSQDLEIPGFIAARELGIAADGKAIVSIPDGEVISVPRSSVVARPQEAPSGVPV